MKKITMFLVVTVIVLLSFFIVNNYESEEERDEREKIESHLGSIVYKFWERYDEMKNYNPIGGLF